MGRSSENYGKRAVGRDADENETEKRVKARVHTERSAHDKMGPSMSWLHVHQHLQGLLSSDLVTSRLSSMLAEPIQGEGGTGHFYGIFLYLYIS